VTVLDGLCERTGGCRQNLAGLSGVNFIDREVECIPNLTELVMDTDLLIDCMGWTCHRLALEDPIYDLRLNVASHLALIHAIPSGSGKRIIYLGSRGQYGNPRTESITEDTYSIPQDIQGSHKQAAETNWQVFSRLKRFHFLSLRFGNCFGPRQPVQGKDIGLIGSFVRDLLQGREIELFGRGRRRPVVYAADVAEAVYRCAQTGFADAQTFNLAGADVALEDLVDLLIKQIGHGVCRLREFPPEVRSIDVGNAVFSGDRLNRFLGGLPLTPLETGLRATIEYFQKAL